LLIQKKPKIWNPIWKEIFEAKLNTVQEQLTPIFRTKGNEVKETMKILGLSLENFDALVALSEKIKIFMENGVNYDAIKIETLLTMVNLEYMDPKTLLDAWSTLWASKQERSME
jgi:hypothetical protein